MPMKSVFIVGHNTIVHATTSIQYAILALIGVYYILDVTYPKCYAGVLGIMQTYYLGDTRPRHVYQGYKSSGYKTLEPQIQDALAAISEDE